MRYLIGKKESFGIELQSVPFIKEPNYGGLRIWLSGKFIGSTNFTSNWGIAWVHLRNLLDSQDKILNNDPMLKNSTNKQIHAYFLKGLKDEKTSSFFYRFLFHVGLHDNHFQTFVYFHEGCFHFIWKCKGNYDYLYTAKQGMTFGAKVKVQDVEDINNQFRKLLSYNDHINAIAIGKYAIFNQNIKMKVGIKVKKVK
jgi:hypothetical protein